MMLNTMTVAADMSSSLKTITEMAVLYQISLRTLRFYEDRKLIEPTRIGTQRFYAAKDEVRLQIVLKGKRLGFTLVEIERLILSEIADRQDVARLPPGQAATVALTPALIMQRIEKLEKMRDDTNEAIAELKRVQREPA